MYFQPIGPVFDGKQTVPRSATWWGSDTSHTIPKLVMDQGQMLETHKLRQNNRGCDLITSTKVFVISTVRKGLREVH